ncbi:hypothetical protein DXG01_001113 [Tephrocybe rancida]|nr:hypothetical protein DXG01_001113 [Tephrocybe rancida]
MRLHQNLSLLSGLIGLVLAQRPTTNTISSSSATITDPASYVLPFIGTTGGGHVFPGATIPHGMVKAGMDTDSPGNHAGYDGNARYKVTGFSQLHDDGTGGTNSIRVELTATRRTALHRYTFPAGTTNPRILFDLTNDGQQSSTDPVLTLDPGTGKLEGGASFAASFGPGSVPEMGGLLTFPPAPNGGTTSIFVRVGVSFISSAQACANAEEEIPDFDFDGVHKSARAQWNDVLGRIQVDPTGVETETVQLFYSSLYRTHIVPADYTGENPKWKSEEPYYDSLYCNWDTYRTLYPLMSLHDPETFARVVRGMVDIQKNEGQCPFVSLRIAALLIISHERMAPRVPWRDRDAFHPRWKQYVPLLVSYLKAQLKYPSDADPILGEFYVKFYKYAEALNVNTEDLYNALLADAENEPPNWNLQGRQANAWKKYNYIPQDIFAPGGANTKQVSRTVEHAFNDFCISQVARVLGKTEDARKYAQRAGNFANVWNPNITVPGGPGVIGMFQDYFDSSNEPSQQMPFMYHYANRPGLSTQRSRQTVAQFFNTSSNGLPGNDDSGAMGSYVTFYLAGLYPLPATNQLLLSSPYFPEISFFNPVLKTTTKIVSKNFVGNPPDGTGGQVFVQSVLVDGKPYKSNCFLEWDVFTAGSLVELTLTTDIGVTCGNSTDALPPSLSTGGYD